MKEVESKQGFDKEWAKAKKTRHQENLRRLTGRFKGTFRENGTPRGVPHKARR